MARIFITGSSDGIGSVVARDLVKRGHSVVLHARSESRANDAENACPGAESTLIGDLSSIADTKRLASEANKLGTFDVVIHNAGLYHGGFKKTPEGFPALFAVNTLAPYVLTCLMNRPKRLVYVSSSMHYSGDGTLKDIAWKERGEKKWSDTTAYCDSKLHDVILALTVARKWKGVASNVLDPGWVSTKMGGRMANGSPESSVKTYVDLALVQGNVKEDDTGEYWVDAKMRTPREEASDQLRQETFLKACEEATGVKFPEA
ncbi:NAD(P)-binding protein [Rhizodiscina lignyota]|uniref:NAD(P)-binding protein n=1 Tax=Rhizodiscina lignyota TaxID=1504668 RepID=A0A9P4IND4_9PEZI|nr:NAD(P)-binding protein [Rhizodiscina lignyota]